MGAENNWKNENDVKISPITSGLAPRSWAYNGRNGNISENPRTSVTRIKNMTRYYRLNSIKSTVANYSFPDSAY